MLTRGHVERAGKTYLEFWLTTANGPVKLTTEAQKCLLFIQQAEQQQTAALLSAAGLIHQIRPLCLKTFKQTPVCAVYFDSASHFYRARELLVASQVEIFESDIRIADRFLMERFVYGSAKFIGEDAGGKVQSFTQLQRARLKPSNYYPSFSVLSIDIECSEHGQLFSIGLVAHNYQKVIMIGAEQAGPEYIHWVEDEGALLNTFVELFCRYDPDIVLGWNVVNFDFKLLVERAKQHHVTLSLGRDGTAANWREGRRDSNQGFISITGRCVIDGIDALKTATYHFDSYSLESVSRQLLGKGKKTQNVENRLAQIEDDFIHNKIALAEYNLQDCQLVLDIFAHTNLLDYLVLRSQLTGLELDRVGGSVAAFVNLYLPKLHRAGYVSPNRPQDGGLASPGGYVMDSRPGLYQNVLVLDFKSLYPSIIRTFKIDPMGLIEGLLTEEDSIPGFKGACFSRTAHFLPDIITSLWQQRDEAKKSKDAARSQAIKILMNSFYGVLGSGGCPFYDTRLASSITMRGHQIMQQTAKFIEQAGYQVIYGDTDSTFVWLEGVNSSAEAFETGEQLATQINHMWQSVLKRDFALHCDLEIEFETLFSTFLMPTIRGSEHGSKKRYAGVKLQRNGQSTLIFKGLETVRSDWTEMAREFQQTLYQMVFDNRDVSAYVRQVITEIRSGEQDDKLIYRKRLRQKLSQYTKNVPPHVKAARMADQLNLQKGKAQQYQNKGWIQYVITLDGPQPVEYQCAALDYEHYIEKQIQPIAEGILPFVNVSFEHISSAQMGLF